MVSWSGADTMTRWLHRHGLRFLFNRVGVIVASFVVIAGTIAFATTASGHHEFNLAPQSAGVGFVVLFTLNVALIFVHELGHASLLVHYGRRVRGAGFRIYFGAPAFFVDSSDALMLPRGRRIAQSFAGPYFEMVATAAAALVLWAFPNASISTTLYRFVVLNVFVLFLNLIPLLELDGYWILSDWLRIPDLRPRSLSFVRHDVWTKLGRRERWSTSDLGLLLYGTVGVGFTVFCLVSAFYFWRRTFGGVTSSLWHAGLLGVLALVVLAAFLAGPVVRVLVDAARGIARNARSWWRRVRFRSQRRWRIEAAELLDEQPVFDDLPVEVLNDLTGRVSLRSYGRGANVVRQGERADAYYLVRSGTLEIVEADHGGGAERVLRRISRGDAFGELGVATGAPRKATVRATSPSEVFVVDKGAFDRLLADRIHLPEFGPTVQDLVELRSLSPFAQMPAEDLAAVRDNGTWIAVAPGHDVVTQGEAGDAYYAVESGLLDVLDQGVEVNHLGPGDAFGELALLTRAPRAATVRARTPARLFRLDAAGFDRLMASALRRDDGNAATAVDFRRE
jgi:putative peptide zinc metalloprotease protein